MGKTETFWDIQARLVAILNPAIVKRSEALRTGRPVYDLILDKGWLPKENLDDLLAREYDSTQGMDRR